MNTPADHPLYLPAAVGATVRQARVADALERGVCDGGGAGGEDKEPGADDEAQAVGDDDGQRRTDAVPQVGVQQGRVEPATLVVQRPVDAVDCGAQHPGHGAVRDAPERDQSRVVARRPAACDDKTRSTTHIKQS